VDGRFWHGKGGLPKANREWWREKLRRNVARDRRANRALKAIGWLPWRVDAEFAKRNPAVTALLVWRELERRR
jgi:G:T-mismatch repair DNA endonuclease (very short patch repair protein)